MLSRRKLSGDPSETLRGGGVSGGSPDILAKSLANPDKSFNFFEMFFLKLLSGFASDLAKKFENSLRGVFGGSLDDIRRDNITGSHGMYLLCPRHLRFQRQDSKLHNILILSHLVLHLHEIIIFLNHP